MSRPFRFGVMTSGRMNALDWRALVRRVDELGYDVLNMPNHRASAGLSPLIAMASAAELSPRLRFGTLVLDNESVDPGVVAKDTATLDVLSMRDDIACVLVNPIQAMHPNQGAPADSTLVASRPACGVDRGGG